MKGLRTRDRLIRLGPRDDLGSFGRLRVSRVYAFSRAGFMVLVVATVTMFGWGILALISPETLNTLSTDLVYAALGQQYGGLIYLVFAGLAGYGILHPGTKGFVLGLFQNALLLAAAGRVMGAVVQAHYAGGTAVLSAPRAFILTDQLLVLTTAVGHLVSLAIYHGTARAQERTEDGG